MEDMFWNVLLLRLDLVDWVPDWSVGWLVAAYKKIAYKGEMRRGDTRD